MRLDQIRLLVVHSAFLLKLGVELHKPAVATTKPSPPKSIFDPTLFVAVCFNVYLETDMTKTSKSLGMPSWLWHFSMARLARRVI